MSHTVTILSLVPNVVLGKDVQLIFNYILQTVHDLALCLNEKGQTGFRIS